MKTWMAAVWIGAALGLSCAATQEKKEKTAQELYDEAMRWVEGTKLWFLPALPDYERALDNFKRIVDDYPYSEYASLSRLMIGEVYFKDRKFSEAVVGYEEFIRMHPSHPKVPHAAFMIGRSYEEDMLSMDRDPTATLNAIDQYRHVVQQYGASEFAGQASERLGKLRKRAAEYELYVAKFYLRRGEYRAALYRLDQLAADYSDQMDRPEIDNLISKARAGVASLEARGKLGEGILPPEPK
ncbi:MAG: outer membrane protein assembly factor BamD [Nitrospirae bacterium]|nr:outer membrane protein assembly factor BamD [Nitrospirota bacterium]